MRIGVIGCGIISERYLQVITERFPETLPVAAVSDIDTEAAKRRASQFGIGKVCTTEEMMADPEIQGILNLTNPWAHLEIGMAVLDAGKHLYTEKPLAMTREEARTLLDKSKTTSLRIGCAPDTVLGAQVQTARELLDGGRIGTPMAVNCRLVMTIRSGRYLTRRIGGILLDMGPYFVTTLATLFGPVKEVAAVADFGEAVAETASASLLTESGIVASLTFVTGGDAYRPGIEVMGTDGFMTIGDPNMFDWDVTVWEGRDTQEKIPFSFDFGSNSRGLGMAEMAVAIEENRPHRASAEVAYHVLDVLLAVEESARLGRRIKIESTCTRPEPMPKEFRPS
jgi:predicted dehydrogenase